MENFKTSLDELIYTWSKVSEELTKLDQTQQNIVKSKYPLDTGFQEILHRLIDWRSELD